MSDASMPARASPSGDVAPWRSPLSVSRDDRPPMRTLDVTSARWIGEHHPALDALLGDYDIGPGSLVESCRPHPHAFRRANLATQE